MEESEIDVLLAGGNIKWCGYWGKQYGVPQKVYTELYDIPTPLLAIYPKKLEERT